jgi:hypothetical protein
MQQPILPRFLVDDHGTRILTSRGSSAALAALFRHEGIACTLIHWPDGQDTIDLDKSVPIQVVESLLAAWLDRNPRILNPPLANHAVTAMQAAQAPAVRR